MRLGSSGEWARGIESPLLSERPGLCGYSQRTDSEGHFLFDVLPPTTSQQVLEIEPDAHHVRCSVQFGSGDRPVLAQGDHDLGEIVLPTAGVVCGSVRDEHGLPLVGSFVWIGHGTNGVVQGTHADASGEFKLEHVPAGQFVFEVCSTTHAGRRFPEVTVVAGETVPRFDLRLKPAEWLRGFVRDSSGTPLPGAQIYAWSEHGQNSDTEETDADGAFGVRLRLNEPSSIHVLLDGYAPSASEIRFPPVSCSLDITLSRMPEYSFALIDAGTRRPIEKFFTQVQFGEFYYDGGHYELQRYPGGRVTLALRPGVDTVNFTVPGSLGRTVMVAPETPPGTTMTVEL